MGGAVKRPTAALTSACTTVLIAPSRSSKGTVGATADRGLGATAGWGSLGRSLPSIPDRSSSSYWQSENRAHYRGRNVRDD